MKKKSVKFTNVISTANVPQVDKLTLLLFYITSQKLAYNFRINLNRFKLILKPIHGGTGKILILLTHTNFKIFKFLSGIKIISKNH